MTHRRLVTVVAAALLSASVTAACGSSGAGSSEFGDGGGALGQAMDRVSGTGPAAKYFEFGDLAAMRSLKIANAGAAGSSTTPLLAPRWSSVGALGSAPLANVAQLLPEAIGLDLYAGDTAVTIGQPPDSAVLLTGEPNTAKIAGRLTALGAKSRTFGPAKGLSFGADNSINMSSALTTKLSLVNQLDQVVTDGKRFAASPNSATLQKVLGGQPSLLHTGKYGEVASCLGDVIAAVVMVPTSGTRATLVGVGVRRPATAKGAVHEVLCVVAADARQAEVHAALAQHLAPSATDPIAQEPVRTWVSATKVSDAGALVRAVLTVPASRPPGYLIKGLFANVLGYWLGSCTAVELAQRHC
jgi:hypothetical protein